jgi:serine/threonine-protein kinase
MSALRDRLSSGGVLPPGHKLGRYEVLSKLASGGMAVVYVASAGGVGGFARLVALKVLHANLAHEEEFISMFLDEARLAARIRHPNVVPTIDISDTIDTGYFLVMEYIEGDHLGALLSSSHKQGERISVPVVLRIVIDALGGLGAAHELRDDNSKPLNIVHRDVSPHNIMVGKDGIGRLTDFGVAKAEDRLTHTRDGQVKGKLAYMAPEQASSGATDSRSDLFSMGIILWECVTGRRLFRADNTAATLTKLLTEEIAAPSAVDPSLAPLDPILRKALERDPAARFQTAEEFIEALEWVAPRMGGVATRRAVTKAVKQYAAEKLARERKLIEAAPRTVRGAPQEASADGNEPSMPTGGSASDVSLWSSSMSRAKPSGLFSNVTAPRLFTARRSGRPTPQPDEAPNAVPEAPPPLGALGEHGIPEAPADQAFEPLPRRRALWITLLIAGLALGGWFALQPFTSTPQARAVKPLPAATNSGTAPALRGGASIRVQTNAAEPVATPLPPAVELPAATPIAEVADPAPVPAASVESVTQSSPRSATVRRVVRPRSQVRPKRTAPASGRVEPSAAHPDPDPSAPMLPNPYKQ